MRNLYLGIILANAFHIAQAAPAISRFESNAINLKVIEGQEVELTWQTTPGATIALNGTVIQGNSAVVVPIKASGSVLTYRLTATAPDGSTTVSDPIIFTPGVHLDGRYIRTMRAPNCEPTEHSDFLDTEDYSRFTPGDCRIVQVANPYFYWSRPRTLKPDGTGGHLAMRFTLYKAADNSVVYSVDTKEPSLILPDHLTTPGLYKWTVTYPSYLSSGTQTTQPRYFEFRPAEESAAFTPTGSLILANIRKLGHPRLAPRDAAGRILTPDQIKTILANDELRKPFELFMSSARAPLPVPADLATLSGNAVAEYLEKVERLIAAAYLEPQPAAGQADYTSNALLWLRALAQLPSQPSDLTGDATNDLANSRIMRTLALGYDVLHDRIDEGSADQALILAAIESRLTPLRNRMAGTLMTSSYNSHLLVSVLHTVQTLMHIAEHGAGEPDEKAKRLAVAWDRMITTMGAWGGDFDSGWGNGLQYGWISMNDYAPSAAAFLMMAGVNITELPALKNFGENFYAQSARDMSGKIKGTFGDYSEIGTSYAYYAQKSFRLFALASQKGSDEWYYRGSDVNSLSTPLPFYNFFLSAMRDRAVAAPPTKKNYLFEDAGIAALLSSSEDISRSAVYFRSSRLGSLNHSHADNNSFTFVSKGRNVFVSGGVAQGDLIKNPVFLKYARPTRHKNAITFDGGIGQAEPKGTVPPAAPQFSRQRSGKLVNFHADGPSGWSVVTGDASLAYRRPTDVIGKWEGLLEQAYRTVAYNAAEGVVLVYDWATSSIPRTWEVNFVTAFPTESVSRKLIVDTGDGSKVCAFYHGNDGKYSASEDLLAKWFNTTSSSTLDPQYRTTYVLDDKRNTLFGVTVITEDCAPKGIVTFLDPTSKMIVKVGNRFVMFNGKEVSISE